MEEPDEVKKEINELLAQKKWGQTRELLGELPAPDIADFLPDLDKADRILLFRLLPRPLASEVFSYLEPKKKDNLLRDLTEEEVRRVLAWMIPYPSESMMALAGPLSSSETCGSFLT